MQICFASHNKNKVKEMSKIMPDGIAIAGLEEIGVTEDIAETGSTLEENAEIKASYVFEKFKVPVFADDSGLIVHALDGEPGVYSARYAGADRDDNKNMELLLEKLQGKNDRSAEFQTVISYIDKEGKKHLFSGTVQGSIVEEKRGKNGFGYDPILQPNGFDETFAELSSEVKNRISHRAKAVQKFLEYLYQTHE